MQQVDDLTVIMIDRGRNTQACRFVILFLGRSGSSWLVSALNSHSEISCRDEMLVALRAQGAEAQLAWAREYFGKCPQSDLKALGFKAKLSDVLAPGCFADLLREFNCRIILLEREDLVRQAVSWIRADSLHEQTGHYNLAHRAPPPPPVNIDVRILRERLRQLDEGRQALRAFVLSLGQPTHRLTYERLLRATEFSLAGVQAFLAVRSAQLSWSIWKATPDDLSCAVSNYSEMRRALARTPWRIGALPESPEHYYA